MSQQDVFLGREGECWQGLLGAFLAEGGRKYLSPPSSRHRAGTCTGLSSPDWGGVGGAGKSKGHPSGPHSPPAGLFSRSSREVKNLVFSQDKPG